MNRTLLTLALVTGFLFQGCGVSGTTVVSLPLEGDATSQATPSGDVPANETAAGAPTTDWPAWRGPAGDGKSTEGKAPTHWSEKQSVVWNVPVPGRGHSSPSISGDRVFLTSAEESSEQQIVLGYDRATGKQLWSTVVHKGGLMRLHRKNSHASATPACDGEHIYAAFINGGGLHVTALDRDGEIAWQSKAGDFSSEHGYGSSPVLYGSLVIVLGDNLTGSFIAALDRATGDLVWTKDRTTTGVHGSYATPIVGHVAGRPQLLVTGVHSTSSYDPDTGDLLWSCNGPAEVTANTIAFDEKWVYSTGGYPEKEILAIRADGSGDVTDTHVVWRERNGTTYVPSPLLHEGHLYLVNDQGIASCFKAENGRQVWQQRLTGNFSSSPVLAGGLIYVTNEAGRTYVFKAGPKFDLVAENDLGNAGFASPAICGGQIFLRTGDSLVCIGEPVTQTASR